MSKYVGKIITNQAPAGYSVFFNGSSKLRTTSFTPVNAGQDFTVEAWAYQTTQTPGGLQCIATPRVSGGSWYFGIYLNNIFLYDEGVGIFSGSAVTPNTWQHLAYSRQGTTHRLFINGVLVATTTATAQAETGAALAIGADTSNSDDLGSPYYGYLSNLRVVIGTALYTASFTPPTQLFPVTNTQILTFQNPAIQDNSTNNRTFISIGSPTVSTFTPFVAYNPAPTNANPLIPAPGVWTLDEALQYTQQGVWPSYPTNAIEDVFSTYLWTGTDATQTITNGIDLSTKGGLVWMKRRDAAGDHGLFDTVRGSNRLISNSTAAQVANTQISSFNTNGFTLSGGGDYNSLFGGVGEKAVGWTFREQAKFFDVVMWTGNGTGNRTIPHALGSTPGFIQTKRTNGVENWWNHHRSVTSPNANWWRNYASLNATNAFSDWGDNSGLYQSPDANNLYIGSYYNASGNTYVAYLFAHDAGGFGAAGTDNVISCGSFNGASAGTVNLGWEPQWILAKDLSSGFNWVVYDVMRRCSLTGANFLLPNSANAEGTDNAYFLYPTATGFGWQASYGTSAGNIYIAIRRGPMRPPTSGTSVFSTSTYSPNTGTITSGFPTDFIMTLDRAIGTAPWNRGFADRLRGRFLTLSSASTGSENTNTSTTSFDSNTGTILNGGGVYGSSYVYEQFRRAPGFFDVVCYTGTGTNDNKNHNLTVVPELIILKARSSAIAWYVMGDALLGGAGRYLSLNTTAAYGTGVTHQDWTSTTFSVGSLSDFNGSGTTYVSYLFATVAGVSKVGSYTGTGTTQQINCGFTNGSRFVMIKRTDSTGDWYVWDSARGIVAGNDPYLFLNNTNAEVTNTDYVDTYSLGFELSSTAPAGLNASGGTYIFLAIA